MSPASTPLHGDKGAVSQMIQHKCQAVFSPPTITSFRRIFARNITAFLDMTLSGYRQGPHTVTTDATWSPLPTRMSLTPLA